MSGLKTHWDRYLNGGYPHYNFSYRDAEPVTEIMEVPGVPGMTTQPLQSMQRNPKKVEFPVIKTTTTIKNMKKQNGGKLRRFGRTKRLHTLRKR